MEAHKLRSVMYRLAVVVAVIMLLQNPVLGATDECVYSGIINLGDSNSDTGGLSAAFGQAPYPHGETFFHAPVGRLCDGRLIIDFIAESLGLPYLNAFLDAVGSNFTHGVNFATAGSSILPQTRTLKQSGFSPISLDVQWAQFNDFHRRTQIFRQKESIFQELLPKPELFSSALYTIDIGQNDLTSALFLNKSTDQVKAAVPEMMDQFKNIVKNVYGQGGRSFWIHNTGPVGCLAYVLVRLPVKAAQLDHFGCATPFNDLAQHFNSKLKEAVVQLRKDLPLAAFTYVDVYSVKYNLFTQTKRLGFKESLKTCCGFGRKLNYNKDVVCGATKKVHGKEVLVAKACKDPLVWINWDGVHYTEAANKYVFDQIVGGSFSDPPIPVKLACHRH
ncbi:GDSL esterase/lipase At3g26430 [Quercus suber]|uniref:GDSL esterase/lipase At3g26430 n=1 Tax=Quercus suber TaxID=58331 RepID=UPI000CE25B71|nr:GDSL esterase/lipase At3g26430-like [Quercus suber]POE71135.1 gdsl esterase/lipase [Quercus suber]